DSWPAVQAALERAGIAPPDGFSQEYRFRRCPKCSSINLIKDEVWECGVCSASLPHEWNLDAEEAAASAPAEDTLGFRSNRFSNSISNPGPSADSYPAENDLPRGRDLFHHRSSSPWEIVGTNQGRCMRSFAPGLTGNS